MHKCSDFLVDTKRELIYIIFILIGISFKKGEKFHHVGLGFFLGGGLLLVSGIYKLSANIYRLSHQ